MTQCAVVYTLRYMGEINVIQTLAALAQPARLRVFRELVAAYPGGRTPTDLLGQLDIAATALSFHLKELLHAGLVTQERDGRYLVYRAVLNQMTDLVQFLTANCCQGEGIATANRGKSVIDVKASHGKHRRAGEKVLTL